MNRPNRAAGSKTGTASWQVVHTVLPETLQDADAETSQRVMKAMLHMKKMDIETLKQAYEG